MDYSELLKHPFWQKKRLRILERDNFACKKCSDTLSNLQVHHTYYTSDSLPWEYPDEALVTLCDLCHLKEEFIKFIKRYGIKYLRMNDGFETSDVDEIIALVTAKLENNHHRESAVRYMNAIKILISNSKITTPHD